MTRVIADLGCIYGVDKNPLAVDLCKVALWLEGHAKGMPLTFLDHRIKIGDSLVGVADLKVWEEGIPDQAYERSGKDEKKVAKALRDLNRLEREGQLSLADYKIGEHILGLALASEELERMPDDSREHVSEKAQQYEKVRATDTDWWADATACHLWVAPFFVEFSPGLGFAPTTGAIRRFVANPKAADGRLYGLLWELSGNSSRPFFHWPLEFPEVLMRDGFDVILSNPPFMGGLKIRDNLGEAYRRYLVTSFPPAGGTADLCAYFYRRAFDLLRPNGHLGMVATNTIGQGDTREAGLAVVVRNRGSITFAHRFIKWPGTANVEVNLVALRKGQWQGQGLLVDEYGSKKVSRPINLASSRLDGDPEEEPKSLKQNQQQAFIGSYVRGIGFVVEPDEAQSLINKYTRNRDCLLPYLNGEDINSQVDQCPSRWVICFKDWPLESAAGYPDLLHIIETRVKPERDMVREKHEREKWWLFARYRVDMHSAIDPLRRVLVRSRIGDNHSVVFVPKGWIYNEKAIVFAFDDDYKFALIQSTCHEAWMRRFTSTLRTDINYAPSDCFDNFPFPQEPPAADQASADKIGCEYHERRRQIMLVRNLGLTKTYNLFNSPQCHDTDIAVLREMHAELDRAILACYGWQNLDPGHGFHQNERGQTRYTISPEARREVLRRLLELNLEVAAKESRSQASTSGRK